MIIEISEAERDLILELLETSLKDISVEIHRTDSRMYKHALEVRQHTMETLVQGIKGTERQATAA